METRVHISVEVSDLERSIGFYSQLFGQTPTRVKPGYANWRLEAPRLHLALNLRPDRAPEPPFGETSRHFGVELFEDSVLAGWLGKVGDLHPEIEEQVTCCYAVADKFWVTDPDGHRWEFWVRKADVEVEGDEEGACCANLPRTVEVEGKAPQVAACCGPAPLPLETGGDKAATSCCPPPQTGLKTRSLPVLPG